MSRWIPMFAVLGLIGGCAQSQPRADLVLTGAKVLTLTDEPAEPAPTAVAIAEGRILYVGSDAEAKRRAAPGARVVDLQGAVVIPGFSDSHCHLYGLGQALAQIDLVGTTSADDALARVVETARQNPQLEWLAGRGWDQNDWPGQRYPHRSQLDAIAPDRPCYLRRIDGHAAWVNGEALRRAGIDRDTPDPEGGAILRDEHGEPTGILIDNAADLVGDVIPEPDTAEVRRRIDLAVDHCLARGLTGVHEAGVSWERAELYRQMAQDGELHLRVYGMYDDDTETLDLGLADGPTVTGDGMFTVRCVKLYADGALGSRGALLLEDYRDDPGNRGLAVTSRDHLLDVLRRAAASGFQVGTHAIGDGGNRLVLDLYEEVLKEARLTDARWRVEHAQILSPLDIPRFAELGVIAAMQPTHCTSDLDWAGKRLGDDRLGGAYAWRTLLDSGAHVCFGTDFPIERVEPLEGLYAARTRQHPDGTPIGGWQPQEKLDGLTALKLYTQGSAWASFREDRLGRIEPGYTADLTVLDLDPVACDAAELLGGRALMTIVNGQVRFEAKDQAKKGG